MKKGIALVLLMSLFLCGTAQTKTEEIVLKKGQVLLYSSSGKGSFSQEMPGQQPVETQFDVFSKRSINVDEADRGQYNITMTMTKMKMDISMMNSVISHFNSDSMQDTDRSIPQIKDQLNIPQRFIMKNSGTATSLDTVQTVIEDKSNPFTSVMQQLMGNKTDETILGSYFMILPANVKEGDEWSDSTQRNNTSSVNHYQWEATEKNNASLKTESKNVINTTMQLMGYDVDISMTTSTMETRKVDISSGIITFKKSTSQISGTMDMMGISIPIKGVMEFLTEKVE